MKKDEARAKAWADWHSGLEYAPKINQLYARGFDAGWAAREAEHAADDELETPPAATGAAVRPSQPRGATHAQPER